MSNIKHVEVISLQFHGLVLTIFGSKVAESGTIIHYLKSTTNIPTAESNMTQAARFFFTVMSLQVSVVVVSRYCF
jgi:hypothetical protein